MALLRALSNIMSNVKSIPSSLYCCIDFFSPTLKPSVLVVARSSWSAMVTERGKERSGGGDVNKVELNHREEEWREEKGDGRKKVREVRKRKKVKMEKGGKKVYPTLSPDA